MNKYEAMFIFPESLKDIEEALGKVRGEIKKHGGDVESTTRLGKRMFARKMKKQDAGQYVIMTFKLPTDQVKAPHDSLQDERGNFPSTDHPRAGCSGCGGGGRRGG